MNAPYVAPLAKEIEAAKVIRDQITDLVAGDPEFLAEALEGETSLFEQIERLVISVRADEALAKGTEQLIADLELRAKAFDKRAELKRALIGSALEIAGLKKRETSAGTVTLKAVAPKVIITDEAAIPSKFMRERDPEVNKKAVGDALKAREAAWTDACKLPENERPAALAQVDAAFPAVPGATLSNGGLTIQIRG